MVSIRLEKPEDIPLIFSVHEQTFKRDTEARLAGRLCQAYDEAFMILVMDEEAMRNVSGIATFRDDFNEAL